MEISARRPLTVITGGAAGIGAAVARKFASEGSTVVILDIDRSGGKTQVQDIVNAGGEAYFIECDVADAQAVEAASDDTLRLFGPATNLVTCAAILPNTQSALTMPLELHDRTWKVNYHGTFHACRSFAPAMIENGGGAIVTLSSINNYLALPLPAYNPSKAAVVRLTQLLAAELGRHDITVNSVAPTYVMMPALQEKVTNGLRDMEKIMSAHALNRLPVPADVADAIFFLTSPQARMITGAILPVDSGWSASVGYMSYAGGVPWERQTTSA